MHFFRRYRIPLSSAVVLVVATAALVVYVLSANGYPVHDAKLNDGGIWVSSDRDGLFGRLNKPAGSLDAAFYPPGGAQQSYQLDVIQDGAAVIARDTAFGKAFPVDVQRGVTIADQGVALPAVDQVQLRGGTVAVLDPPSGRVFASVVDSQLGAVSLAAVQPSSQPVATVGQGTGGALAVAVDGTVFAAAGGRLATVRRDAVGFGAPYYSVLPGRFGAVRMTAVGDQPVLLDPVSGTVLLPSGKAVTLPAPDPAAVLQQPGPANPAVLVQTAGALYSIGLDDGAVDTVTTAAHGTPTEPVRLGPCVHAAWAGATSGYQRACYGEPMRPGNLADATSLIRPVFRVNRNAIVLNDLASGKVWDLSNQRKVDDWSSVKPPPVQKPNDKDNNHNPTDHAHDKPPKAVDDTLGARPGSTTVLHVLDNDSDPAGNILSISGITTPSPAGSPVTVAPDGQTVQIALAHGATSAHFTYTVDDGKGLTATASVSVQARSASDNKPPRLRPGAKQPSLAAAAGGTVSIPALADWRDFDGDPVVLVGASVPAGSVTTTAAGFVNFTAPLRAGPQPITYQVTDGRGAPVSGKAVVVVQAADATTAVPAVAQPDVAKGQVGHPITIRPLDNDLPGADASDPDARLTLAADVPAPAGLAVDTDLRTGVVTAKATKPGTYRLDYQAAFGNAAFAKGVVRVDVTPVPASPLPPVAVPDSAVVRGMQPVTVDVLANDFNPGGGLLAVQDANAPAQLQVAVIKGRWLRINALAPGIDPNPESITYRITDGVVGPSTGVVTVTQLPPPADDTPVPQLDHAVVRAGDAVAIPVLDNDTTPSGTPITLQGDVTGAPGPGRLTVTPTTQGAAAGAAYVSGGVVRYVAPSAVPTTQTVSIDYVAQNAAGDQAVGHAQVTINPAPTPARPDQPPAPQDLDARVVAGDVAVVTVPVSGVDPDGDSVTVTAIGSATTLGRVTALGATSISYEAYPTVAGSDTLDYLVTDRYGKTGRASVRIAVVPPGAPQPPVAVDDAVTAAPGAHVNVDLLANDLYPAGQPVTVAPIGQGNPGLPADAVVQRDPDGIVDAVSPELTGKPLVVVYRISSGLGEPSAATLTVRSRAGYNAPPVVGDVYPQPDGTATSVQADVLAKAGDPDGDQSGLTVDKVYDDTAKVTGGRISWQLQAQPRTVAFEVRDAGGATAVGFAHLPSVGSGVPHAKPGRTITVPKGGSTTAAIADYVVDPAGKPVKLTVTEKITGSPSAGLAVRNDGDTKLVLTGKGGYNGPAAVTFEVTDGTSLTDPHGQTVLISVPVQVGDDNPVLRCPDDALPVVEGGNPTAVDVTSVCHVWAADRGRLADLRYTASWAQQVSGVDIGGSGSHLVTITAGGAAKPGTSGTLDIGLAGSSAAHASLAVRVVAAPPPALTPITVDGVKAGDTATVDLTPYLRSQLRDPAPAAISVRQSGGLPAAATNQGAQVRITPGAQSHGTLTFTVVASDVADPARTDRQATGEITLHVLGVPDAPGVPSPGRTVLSKVVELSWRSPASNGAPVDSYQVDYPGGSQTCAASPCTINGLTNGRTYSFTVKAHNLVGWSNPSGASAGAQPNTVPGAVSALAVSDPQDHTVKLTWAAPPNEGTPVQHYEVSWGGGGRQSVSGTSTTATGLDNEASYTFRVIAVNAQGPGPAATATGQSAGKPETPAAPQFHATTAADGNTRAVTVSWNPVSPNGPKPTTYTLTRTGGGNGKTVCASVAATSCTDDGLANDGTTYTYSVTAANGAAAADPNPHTSQASPGTEMEATATPDPITNFSVTPTGSDNQATIRFDAPATHGASSTITCTWDKVNSCGSWTYPTGGQAGASRTIGGLPNGRSVEVALTACNGSHGGQDSGSACDDPVSAMVTTYGPIRDLNITTSANNTVVNYSVSVNPNGKPAHVRITSRGGTKDFDTTANGWNYDGSDNIGYSSSDTISVTVSDSGRATVSGSKTQNTQAAPPPPPSVSVYHGTGCTGGCTGCTHSSCAYIGVQTANFTGSVTCSFNSDKGSSGFVSQTYGANERRNSRNWYGYPGTKVYVTCGGVQGELTW